MIQRQLSLPPHPLPPKALPPHPPQKMRRRMIHKQLLFPPKPQPELVTHPQPELHPHPQSLSRLDTDSHPHPQLEFKSPILNPPYIMIITVLEYSVSENMCVKDLVFHKFFYGVLISRISLL